MIKWRKKKVLVRFEYCLVMWRKSFLLIPVCARFFRILPDLDGYEISSEEETCPDPLPQKTKHNRPSYADNLKWTKFLVHEFN